VSLGEFPLGRRRTARRRGGQRRRCPEELPASVMRPALALSWPLRAGTARGPFRSVGGGVQGCGESRSCSENRCLSPVGAALDSRLT